MWRLLTKLVLLLAAAPVIAVLTIGVAAVESVSWVVAFLVVGASE